MKKITILLVLFISGGSMLKAQESSDPQAKALLEAMKAEYDSYASINTNFSLTIQFPEEEPEIQKGELWVAGDKFHLTMKDQSIICDGSTLWFYLKSRNEVQINDYEEEESDEIMSPKDLFKIYEKEDYIYAIVFEGNEAGKKVQKVEFKPTDLDSEYSKMRITVDKNNKRLIRVKTFAKDGSRYTLALDSFTSNKTVDADQFVFNAADYPNVQIEDLRN